MWNYRARGSFKSVRRCFLIRLKDKSRAAFSRCSNGADTRDTIKSVDNKSGPLTQGPLQSAVPRRLGAQPFELLLVMDTRLFYFYLRFTVGVLSQSAIPRDFNQTGEDGGGVGDPRQLSPSNSIHRYERRTTFETMSLFLQNREDPLLAQTCDCIHRIADEFLPTRSASQCARGRVVACISRYFVAASRDTFRRIRSDETI